jgi:thiamine-phosphate diphosphorylase
MNAMPWIGSLAQARQLAGDAGDAPAVARQLRARGIEAACILDDGGQDWMETPHARGWLVGPRPPPPQYAAGVQRARERGFVAADAFIVARMADPHALPVLSWAEGLPAAPVVAPASRRLDLYAVVDSAERLEQVLDAGVRTVQLRIKTPAAPDAAWQAMLRAEVQRSVAAARRAGAELFINDHWQLAAELGAPGVHLGQEDLLALGDAGRAALQATGMALGVSSHSLWELARARTLSPSYIACGPVWATLTKDMPWLPQGLDNLSWWCRAAGVRVTAIGGILEPAQVQAVARTGTDGICIVRGLGADPRSSLPAFQAAMEAGRRDLLVDAPAWPHPTLPHGGAAGDR